MSSVLDHEQQQQILALARLGWTVSRIATATGRPMHHRQLVWEREPSRCNAYERLTSE